MRDDRTEQSLPAVAFSVPCHWRDDDLNKNPTLPIHSSRCPKCNMYDSDASEMIAKWMETSNGDTHTHTHTEHRTCTLKRPHTPSRGAVVYFGDVQSELRERERERERFGGIFTSSGRIIARNAPSSPPVHNGTLLFKNRDWDTGDIHQRAPPCLDHLCLLYTALIILLL
jgi:hypothetical protein